MTDARKIAGKRLREMPRDWPERIAVTVLAKLERADDYQAQIDVVARYLLYAYMKGRA